MRIVSSMAAEAVACEAAEAGRGKKKWRQPKPKPRKKRPCNPEEWHKQKQKRLRIAGKEHINTNGKVIPAKKPGEDCHCRRKCYERIPESVRTKTFEGFYSMKTHDEQNAYLFGLMRQIDIKRKRKKDSSRRTCTFEYYIRVRGRETQVCQTAFKNIHAITERKVRVLCKKMDDGVMFPSDNRGKNRSSRFGETRLAPEIIDQIKSHIYSIVHTHQLKDFIRLDNVTGLEINVSKMWKDYIKTYEPSFSHCFESSKTKKKTTVTEEQQNPPQIMTNNVTQEMPGPSSDTYCFTYTGNGSILNVTENYIKITPTMVASNQYPTQHVNVGNYINTDKINYYSQRPVVVQPGGVQQLLPSADSLTLPIATQQTYAHPHPEQNFFIVQSIPAQQMKQEQAANEDKSEKTKNKKQKNGPLVRQWRYTYVFQEEIHGEVLAEVKSRLPLYFTESESKSKKKKSASQKSQSPTQQSQPIACQPTPCQTQCQPIQCQQTQCQPNQCQQQQQFQTQNSHVPPVSQSIQHLHG